MSEYDIETRLLGKEDINFDTEGTNAQDEYTDQSGVTHPVTKLNAAHIPLLGDTRSATGATNIDKALANLAEEIQEVATQQSTAMSEDTTIVLDDYEHRQETINAQLKNLGGHTLTFQFPASVDVQVSTTPLDFSGFYNGKLVIDLNSDVIADNGTLDKDGIFRIENCHCATTVKNGTIKYLNSNNHYGVVLVQVPNCEFDSVAFVGASSTLDYGVYAYISNFYLYQCSFTTSNKQKIDSAYNDVIDVHVADPLAHKSLFDEKAAAVHSHSISDVTNLQTSLDGKAASSHSHTISDVTNLQTTLNGKADSSSLPNAFLYHDFRNLNSVINAQDMLRRIGLFGSVPLPVSGYNQSMNSGGYLFLPLQCGGEDYWVPIVIEWGTTGFFVSSGTASVSKSVTIPVPIQTCLHLSFVQTAMDSNTPHATCGFDGFTANNKFTCFGRKDASGDTQFKFQWFLIGVYDGYFDSFPFDYDPED
jgi:hypothetical protein